MDNFRLLPAETLPASFSHPGPSAEQQASLDRWAVELRHLTAHRDCLPQASYEWHQADYFLSRARSQANRDLARYCPT